MSRKMRHHAATCFRCKNAINSGSTLKVCIGCGQYFCSKCGKQRTVKVQKGGTVKEFRCNSCISQKKA